VQQVLREKNFFRGMKKINNETARLYKELSVHGDICLSGKHMVGCAATCVSQATGSLIVLETHSPRP
jgi:hypothetical protein